MLLLLLLLLLLFLTSNKTNGRVPSQQGASTLCNLTYWELSQQTYLQTLLASLVVAKGHNSDLISGRGLGKIGVAKRGTFSPSVKRGWGSLWQKSMSPILDINSPQTTTIIFIPAKLSVPEHVISSKSSSQPKVDWRTDIFWGPDSLGANVFHLHALYTE